MASIARSASCRISAHGGSWSTPAGICGCLAPKPEPIRLDPQMLKNVQSIKDVQARSPSAMLELSDGAVAGSETGVDPQRAPSSHWDGRTRTRVRTGRFAAVTVPDCMIADALTKVVLSWDERAAPLHDPAQPRFESDGCGDITRDRVRALGAGSTTSDRRSV